MKYFPSEPMIFSRNDISYPKDPPWKQTNESVDEK